MLRLIGLLIIAAVCGSIGAKLGGMKSRGCVTSIILGFAGALIGSWLSRKLQIPDLFYIRGLPVVWSIIGASLFVALLGFLGGHKKNSR